MAFGLQAFESFVELFTLGGVDAGGFKHGDELVFGELVHGIGFWIWTCPEVGHSVRMHYAPMVTSNEIGDAGTSASRGGTPYCKVSSR